MLVAFDRELKRDEIRFDAEEGVLGKGAFGTVCKVRLWCAGREREEEEEKEEEEEEEVSGGRIVLS